MLFTVYRTTNNVNGKYYIGVHKTDNPMDEYLGSGKHLKYAIAKYGESNFTKEILLSSHSHGAAFALEYELVEKHRGDPLCYNLRQGGSGGFDYINRKGLHTQEAYEKAGKAFQEKMKDPAYRSLHLKRSTAAMVARNKLLSKDDILNRVKHASKYRVEQWKGGKHTDETRKKMSSSKIGNKNQMFGKHWIYNPEQRYAKRVEREEIDDYLKTGWKIGRRMYKD